MNTASDVWRSLLRDKSHRAFHLLCLLLILLIIIGDQLTKYDALRTLTGIKTIPIMGNMVSFTLVRNTGASFGMLQDMSLLLLALSVIAALAIIYHYPSVPHRLQVFVALLLGGVIGNLIDRIFYGFVIDFFHLSFWPAFNVADIAITTGAIRLLIYYMTEK